MRRCARKWLLVVPFTASALAGGGPNPTARNPLSDPFFSIDLSSSEVTGGLVKAGDILIPFGPVGSPTVVIPAFNHKLNDPLDELDALASIATFGSFDAERGVEPTFALIFSVDRFAQGNVPPDPGLVAAGFPFNVFEQSNRRQAAGDAFIALTLFNRSGPVFSLLRAVDNNTLVFNHGDAGGIDYNIDPATASPDTTLPPMTPISDADASMGFGAPVAMNAEGARGATGNLPFYFSVSQASPSLPLLPGTNSGADVYVDDLPDQPIGERLYVPPGQLGLQHDDDINALIVFDDGDRIFEPLIDQVIFTLTSDSPTLGIVGLGPGDVFSSRGGGVFTLFAGAHRLGVRHADVVDMLDYVPCNDIMSCVQDWAIGLNCACPGDTNCDGVVDLIDLTNLLSGFGFTAASPFYNERLDFNLDGAVNLNDLTVLLANFGLSCAT
jgi:hypothetical protein